MLVKLLTQGMWRIARGGNDAIALVGLNALIGTALRQGSLCCCWRACWAFT